MTHIKMRLGGLIRSTLIGLVFVSSSTKNRGLYHYLNVYMI